VSNAKLPARLDVRQLQRGSLRGERQKIYVCGRKFGGTHA